MNTRMTVVVLVLLVAWLPVAAGEWETSGSADLELRWFFHDPRYPGQLSNGQSSLILSPEFDWESKGRRHQISVAPFLRLDGQDDERTHFDLREAFWRGIGERWEVVAGVNTVYWGVTESRHLVNVINQTDAVENIDEEDRLGQPMLQVATQRDWGRLEAFVLLGFRERTFPGRDGRLRTPLVVATDDAIYESGAGEQRLDGALRYSHYVGDWDIGAHWFHGTGREPSLAPSSDSDSLIPFYQVTNQLGVDVQYTREAWLWKLEAIGREGQGDTFGAAVGGFEYTFYQIGKSAADIGVLVEYLYDGRDETAPVTAFDDDVFVGSRLALNDLQDTQVLAGAIVDVDDQSVAAFIEAERRIGSHYKVELEARWFLDTEAQNPLDSLDRDSFLSLGISRHF